MQYLLTQEEYDSLSKAELEKAELEKLYAKFNKALELYNIEAANWLRKVSRLDSWEHAPEAPNFKTIFSQLP